MERAPLRFALRALAFTGVLAGCLVLLDAGLARLPARLATALALPGEMRLARVAPSTIVMTGDSVLETVAEGEDPSRTLAAMVAERLEARVEVVGQPAYGPAEHRAQVRFLMRSGARPRAMIVEVNPRALSAHWARNPLWDLEPQRWMLETGRLAEIRGLMVLGFDFGRLSLEDFLALPVRVSGRAIGTLGELDAPFAGDEVPPEVGRARYVVRYAADLAPAPLGALEELLAELRAAPWPTLVYLTPVDRDAITARLDARELAAFHHNLDRLRQILARSGLAFADLSVLLPGDAFDHHPDDPHEHLRLAGRSRVAAALAAHRDQLMLDGT